MKSSWFKSRHTIILLLIMVIGFVFPSMIFSAGYQEEKLFDGEFYTTEDLRRKIEHHTKQVDTLKKQIKSLETDIDWLVLKINQIEDTGRTASYSLKNSIKAKEKKVQTLSRSKSRLEYLVQYYSAMLDSTKKQELDEIFNNKVPGFKMKEKPRLRSEKKIEKKSIIASTPVAMTPVLKLDQDLYDGVSKLELETAVKKAGLSDWVEIVGTGSCLRIETTLPILFPTGSAKLAGEYKSFFKKLAGFLKPYDVKVLVTGYADKVPIQNKKYPSNFELGATRAANIVHQFVSYGLKPSIFRIESTGKYRFAAKQPSVQKSLERRAEVTVIFSG